MFHLNSPSFFIFLFPMATFFYKHIAFVLQDLYQHAALNVGNLFFAGSQFTTPPKTRYYPTELFPMQWKIVFFRLTNFDHYPRLHATTGHSQQQGP